MTPPVELERLDGAIRWRIGDEERTVDIPLDASLRPGPLDPGERVAARFVRNEARVTVEATLVSLYREVNLRDWLRYAWIGEREGAPASTADPARRARFDLRRAGGRHERFVCWRDGGSVLVLHGRAEGDAGALEWLDAAIDGIDEPDRRRFAEPMRRLEGEEPVSWRIMAPERWLVVPGAQRPEMASLQLENRHEKGALVGKAAVAVTAARPGSRPSDLAGRYLEALRSHGIEVDHGVASFRERQAPEGFVQAWGLVSAARRRGSSDGEVRCRVLRHRRAWLFAGMVGSGRGDDLQAWLENARALELLADHARIV